MSEFRKPEAYKSLNASEVLKSDEPDELFLGNSSVFYDLLQGLKSLLI